MTLRGTLQRGFALAGLALLSGVLQAQNADTKDTPGSANAAANYWANHFTLHGSARVRWEATQGSDFSATPADSYALTRVRLSLGYEPISWFRVLAEAQDSRAMNYQTQPSASFVNPFDLRQAYFELGKQEGQVWGRAGRQELTLGSGRLIASADWGNVPKNFDILRGAVRAGGMKLDLAAGSVVLADPKRMDRHKPGEHFYAAYSTWSNWLPAGTVEPYFIAKTQLGVKSKTGKVGDADTLAAGLRVTGKIDGGFDYSAEAVHEMGSYSNDQVRAWGTATTVGWTASSLRQKPRFIAEYVFATGDSGKKDSAHQAFDFMYGLNQPMNSYTGQFVWRNLKDLRFGVAMNPLKKLRVAVDFRDYWLANTQDGLYNIAGTRTAYNILAKSSHVGESLEANAAYSFSKTVIFGVGVANLFPGEYLREAKKTSGFVYPFLYLSKKF